MSPEPYVEKWSARASLGLMGLIGGALWTAALILGALILRGCALSHGVAW